MFIKKYLVGISLAILAVGAFMIFSKKQQAHEPFGTVIILNGPSAVGKTSIIKVFQADQKMAWLSIGIDNFFVGVLPPKFYLEDKSEHHSIMQGIASQDDHGNKLLTLKVGAQGFKIIKGMHRAIAAYAQQGNNVIVDYINYDPSWIEDLKQSLKGIKVLWVGVHASLEAIEQREKSRATSPQGHARSHYSTVHQGINYDINIDTDSSKPEASAQLIADALKG